MMSNRFYFGDDDDSNSNRSDEADDLDSLPFAKPLKRSDFLTPTFSPTEYLSTLRNRHQTLEDLRAELQHRSIELSKELLNLVNENYQEFLSLGNSLRGGDERVEEVKVGLLGFRREIQALAESIDLRKLEIEDVVHEKKVIRETTAFGRGLLELERRVEHLEEKLLIRQPSTSSSLHQHDVANARIMQSPDGNSSDSSVTEEVEEGEGEPDHGRVGESEKQLRSRIQQYILVKRLEGKLGSKHPFILNQQDRRTEIRQTLLLDMNSALKVCMQRPPNERHSQLYILETYSMMGEVHEYMKVLHDSSVQIKDSHRI